MKNILALYRYVKDERNRLITTAIVSTVLSSASIITPLLFRHVINELTTVAKSGFSAHLARELLWVFVALAGLQLLSSIFEFFQERLSDRLSADISLKLQNRIFEHMMQLSIDYYERSRVGETLQKVQSALFLFTWWLNGLTQGTLAQLIQLILATGLLWYINPWIGAATTVLMLSGIIIQIVRTQRSREIRSQVRQAEEAASGHMTETITHIATIRSSVVSLIPITRYQHLRETARQLTYRQNNIEQYGNLARSVVNDIAVVTAIAIVSWLSLHGHATPGDVVAVALYVQQITGAIGPLGHLIVQTSRTETSVERIIELLETAPTVVDAPDAVELKELRTIEFRNVSFTYPGKPRKVLHDVSFVLEHGKTLALVGPSGTGKTTITKLLLRFYEPTAGEILINGQPIQHFTQESVRARIGMVMQDVALFNETVTANLQLARTDATEDEIKAAARQAHADVFISNLPEQYDTLVGERGVKLSGGEKQRVAVARAILKDPDMIALDEATSALDSESERHVQAGLHRLMAHRTAIIIAHRLSTVMQADEILVMRSGKIVERGTHADLADKDGGLYARLFKLQTEGALT